MQLHAPSQHKLFGLNRPACDLSSSESITSALSLTPGGEATTRHLHMRHRASPYRSLSKLPQREVVYEWQLRRGERERQVAVLRVLLVAVV